MHRVLARIGSSRAHGPIDLYQAVAAYVAMTMSAVGLRWAVNCTAWSPGKHDWLNGVSLVQREERERIGKFVFSRDAKLALVGRLLIRAALVELMGVANHKVILSRSGRGKPVVEGELADAVSFNISHQGDYAVLACEGGRPVGVDVMKFTKPRGACVGDFFHTMRRQFTEREWSAIKQPTSETQQLQLFYRFWCLKESFIKAEGTGLAFGLQNVEFTVDPVLPWPPPLGETISSSQLYLEGELSKEWVFQESLLDPNHCVAVAVQAPPHSSEVLNKLLRSSCHGETTHSGSALDREWDVYLSKLR